MASDQTGLRPEVLDEGLQLAMAWGEDWLRPIQERLGRSHPELDADQLDRYDRACRATMTRGHDVVRAWAGDGLELGDELRTHFQDEIRQVDPWVSDASMQRLYSQACYYAMK